MKRKYFYTQKCLKENIAYKANIIIFLVLCFLLGIDKKNTNNKVKNAMCLYAFNHNKFIRFIAISIRNIFAFYMLIFKYDIEYLNSISLNSFDFKKLNEKYYNDTIKYNDDYETYDLKRYNLFLFFIRFYIMNVRYLYYTIQDELGDTMLYYYDKRYNRF